MKKKLFLYLVVPLALTVFLIGIFLIRLITTNFTSRMFYYEQTIDSIEYTDSTAIFDVYSKDNYFGILSITSTINLIPTNAYKLTVSFKNKNDGSIIVTNTYKAFDISNMTEFSFGLPVQNESKNSWYSVQLVFECDGNCNHFLFPEQVIMRHYFPKDLFIKDPFLVITYFQKKIASSILETPSTDYLQIFVFPMLLYYFIAVIISIKIPNIFTHLEIRNIFQRYLKGDVIIIALAVLDSFSQNNLIFLSVLFLLILRIKKISISNLTSTIGFSFIIVLFFLIINVNYLAIRYSTWLFIMLSYLLLTNNDKSKDTYI